MDARDFEENTVLIREASSGCEDNVRSLLSRGAYADAQNVYGYTALLAALSKGFASIALALLNYGANVHISTLEGLSPLHMAVMHCDESVVSALIHCGAFLGVQDEEGDTPLHWAIREGRQDMLSFLLDNKSVCASMETPNEDGETPLHIAAALGEEDMVEMLVKQGACVDVKDEEGRTPADNARENAHFKLSHSLSLLSSSSNNKGRRMSGNNAGVHPYQRSSCGDVRERKSFLNPQHLSSSIRPAHFC